VNEKILRFGPGRGLTGVLSLPEEVNPSIPGVVFLNSGILHHVGPSRLYVRLARRLAEDGHLTFRFDFSGIGDSESRPDTLSFTDSAPVEAGEAMDLLQKKYGIDEWILIGLCSGADMAYKVALQDERVTGMVQLDSYAYRTPGYYLRRYGPKLLDPRAYLASFRGRRRNAELARQRAESGESYTPPEYRRIFPPREEVEQGLAQLVGRRVRMLNIFSDQQQQHINHAAQYARAFPSIDFGDLLTAEYVNHAAHTFTDLADQELVERTVARWAEGVRAGLPAPKADLAAAS
jgi:pimeloyl-ACP methyl ester carboxylesterase